MVPEGAILGSKYHVSLFPPSFTDDHAAQAILAAGRFVVRLSVVQQVAAFFRSQQSGESAASTAAQEISEAAAEAEKGIQGSVLASGFMTDMSLTS